MPQILDFIPIVGNFDRGHHLSSCQTHTIIISFPSSSRSRHLSPLFQWFESCNNLYIIHCSLRALLWSLKFKNFFKGQVNRKMEAFKCCLFAFIALICISRSVSTHADQELPTGEQMFTLDTIQISSCHWYMIRMVILRLTYVQITINTCRSEIIPEII